MKILNPEGKDREGHSKIGDSPSSSIDRNNIVKMTLLPKATYTAITVKIPISFFTDIEKVS